MSEHRTRIAAVSGSRADWGLLQPVLAALRAHPQLELLLWVTGSHLEPRFGNTVDTIRSNGFAIDAEVPLGLATESALHTSQALARSVEGFARLIDQKQPDLLLILGDRYEIFGAVQAAFLARVPIAHIAGGDISEGAYDDAMRHAISKLSHLHFATNEEAHGRLLQMGESPDSVITSGSPGIDAIINTERLSRDELGRQIGFEFQARNLAISFHPATLDELSPRQQVEQLLEGLNQLDPEIGMIFSGSNADTGGDAINGALQGYASQRPHSCFVQSLGARRYYSLVAEVDLLVGNSSSGLYEAPSLHTLTLDIGTRQQGRLRGNSVYHCDNNASDIGKTIKELLALTLTETDFENPYGDGKAATRIVDALAAIENPQALLQKHFHQRAST